MQTMLRMVGFGDNAGSGFPSILAAKSVEKLAEMQEILLSQRQKQILECMELEVLYKIEEIAEKVGLKGPSTRQLLNELVAIIFR